MAVKMANTHIGGENKMDRTKYLHMAQECAMISVKNNIPSNLRVAYGGIEYYPAAYTLAFDALGNPRHMAVLHDLKANAVTNVELKDVVEVGKDG
jgi:hypothetical protein